MEGKSGKLLGNAGLKVGESLRTPVPNSLTLRSSGQAVCCRRTAETSSQAFEAGELYR